MGYNRVGDIMEKQLTSEIIYDGSVIHVKKDQVLCENGIESVRECVSAPGGVAILAIKNHAILLVKQFRYVVGEDTLEIPAGKIEPNEKLEVTAMRELEEETGYICHQLTKRFTFYPTPGFCSETLHIFEAEGLTKVEHPKNMDIDEDLTSFFLNLDDAYQLVMDGTIKDSKTIIAIQYAHANLM